MYLLAMSPELENIIRSFIGELPVIIVALLGLIFTIARSPKLGAGALPAMAGAGCILLLSLYMPFHYQLVMRSLVENLDIDRVQSVYLVSHLLLSLIFAAGVGLLILGAHLGRESHRTQ